MEPSANHRQTLLEALSGHVAEFDLERAPAETVARLKACLLDLLGCLLAGTATEPAGQVAEMVERQGGLPQASVAGRSRRVPAEWAALANGVAAHALELDDAHRFATGLHPAATVIPAALATAEMVGASGKELLQAILVGYDVAGRIGTALNPSHRYRGFHSTGTIGPFGAAAASARLLGLRPQEVVAALSLVASQGAGVFEFLVDGSTVKLLHAGWAAQKGVQAALLAQAGLSGPASALEGREGFARAYAEELSLEGVAEQLGSCFEVDRSYFKLHAACGQTFSAIDAAMALRDRLGISGKEAAVEGTLMGLQSIEVRTYRAAAVLDNREPTTERQARFSIPYCVGTALILGNAGLEAFGPEARNLPAIRYIASMTHVLESAPITASFPAKRTAVLEAVFSDGRRLTETVDYPRGMPENPASVEELEEKFHQLAAARLDLASRELMVRQVGSLQDLESIAELTSSLRSA